MLLVMILVSVGFIMAPTLGAAHIQEHCQARALISSAPDAVRCPGRLAGSLMELA